MTEPLLAESDKIAVSRITNKLPQSLIIHAEQGLDYQLLVKMLCTQASDLFTIKPEEDKKHITVQQVRDLIYQLRTFTVHKRIVVIDPADKMNEESQNALLKILEEPAENLHFILVTSNIVPVIDTVISRCQILTLHRTSSSQDAILLENSDLDGRTKQQILFLANGRPALIRQLIRQPKLLNQYKDIAASAKSIVEGSPYNSLVASQKFANSREEALKLVDMLLTIVSFQIKFKKQTSDTSDILDRIYQTESALKANGNIKLALLQLVV